ncbi:MFS transporter [Actinocorallia populi]|uniref:MFS transporter n=1 Tax=Actinocorallia populi TaxID=2079200 RepID=UPI000D08D35A|nr:DHA2 family efflux MFS transporter permease subunit [Actinocorallia populi]
MGREGGAQSRGIGLILTALLLGMLLGALDQTIVSTALPTIVSEFGGLNHLSWVVTAYMLASTASTPLWGKLGDQYGRKPLYVTAIVVFLVGSALCGLAWDMLSLIGFRALQGLGGGGLMALGMGIIADVVSPRERGRYQGYFGGVFGVASVTGPLLGGFFVDTLSWRWVFYVNLPIGAVALAVIVTVLQGKGEQTRHRIDYAGTFALGGAAVCLVLGTTWGGTEYSWGSPVVLGLFAGAVLLLGGWWLAERRAAEPVLPLHLFGNPVFSICGLIAFVIGFAMFGALTYLAVYFQVVEGVSPTLSGLSLLPMTAGTLTMSILSGHLITRTGRYKVWPVLGTGITTLALALCSRLDVGTGVLERSAYLVLLGAGLGCVMQVLIIAVQNTSPYRDLGAATSGNTFFRSIGGSFGVAAFGAIFSNHLASGMADLLREGRLPPGTDAAGLQENSALIRRLPPEAADAVLGSYAQAIQTVFVYATPVAAVAFVASWFLREVPLRTATRDAAMGESMGAPTARTSKAELELALARLLYHDRDARALYGRLAAHAGADLPAGSVWALCRIASEGPDGSIGAAELAARARTTRERGRPYIDELVSRGLVVREGAGGARLAVTAAGRDLAERIFLVRRLALDRMVEDWQPELHPELAGLLERICRESLGADADSRVFAG